MDSFHMLDEVSCLMICLITVPTGESTLMNFFYVGENISLVCKSLKTLRTWRGDVMRMLDWSDGTLSTCLMRSVVIL